MNFRGFAALFAAVCLGGSAFAADTWYVDPVGGNDGWDGASSNFVSGATGPRRTLASAMALVKAGDTLCLLPGDYADGSMARTASEGSRFRVTVTNKDVTVKSLAGPAATRIVGAGTSESDANALACAGVMSGCTGVVFDGITFANGCAYRVDSANIRVHGGGLSAVDTTWAINCVFTNCSARFGGGQCYGKSARCRYIDCRCNASGAGDAVAYTSWHEFCLFTRTGSAANSSLRATYSTASYPTKVVNCTFFRCRAGCFSLTGSGATVTVMNTLAADNVIWSKSEPDNGASQSSGCIVRNSVLGTCKNAPGDIDGVSLTSVSAARAGLANPWAYEDYRLVPWGKAATIGDAALVQAGALPTGYAHLDLAGNPVPASGAIAAGCFLETVPDGTVTGATFDFSDLSVSCEIEGVDHVFDNTGYVKEYYRPLAEPWAYRIRPVNVTGKQLVLLTAPEEKPSTGSTQSHYAMADGWTPFAASLPAESNLTISASFTGDSSVRYVNDATGSDSYDGTSATFVSGTTGPWKTLAHACTNASSGALVRVAPGVYDEGYAVMRDDQNGFRQFRRAVMTRPIHLVATEGPEKTFIVGAPDPTTGGRGADAIAGLGVESSCYHGSACGFTITGCHTAESDNFLSRGAAVMTKSNPFLLVDCVLTNNNAYMASAIYQTMAIRCRISGNRSYAAVVTGYANCLGCALYDNYCEIGADDNSGHAPIANNSALYGCTLDLNGRGRPNDATSPIYGSILYGGYLTQRADYKASVDAWPGCVFAQDPLFADRAVGDYRLGVLSPAVRSVDYWKMPFVYRIHAVRDTEGRALVGTVAGTSSTVTAGGVQAAPLACAVIGGGAAGETVSPGRVGTNVVTAASEVTFTASANRPLDHFEVNGESVEPTGASYAFTPSATAGAVTTVKAVYGTDWYVDQASGSDANDGGAATRAKATISAATSKTVGGDTVHVARGAYGAAEANALAPGAEQLLTRVIVPGGVTVVATEGRAVTSIVGGECPEANREGRWTVLRKYGTGPGAARCVYLGSGAKLVGFTLREGRTRALNGINMDLRGAAAYGADVSATVEDCLVTNNVCWYGSLFNVTANRCRVVGNTGVRATGNWVGPAGVDTAWRNCWIDGNVDYGTLVNPVSVVNTFVGTNNLSWADQKVGDDNVTGTGKIGGIALAFALSSEVTVPVLNSVLADYIKEGGVLAATNTIYDSNAYRIEHYWTPSACAGCTSMSLANIIALYDADGKLASRTCAAVDAAVANDALGATDIFGNPRVSNGAPDIGPVEYDWRPVYAADIGRRVTVAEASPCVTETARKGVSLGADGTVLLTCLRDEGRSPTFVFTFVVTGTGTLTVAPEGGAPQTFTQSSAKQKVRIAGTGSQQVRFTYAPGPDDAGSAEILRATSQGFVVLFR